MRRTARQWIVQNLPGYGCGPRHVSVDDLGGEVWPPCDRSSKIARFEFPTVEQIQTQKAAAADER